MNPAPVVFRFPTPKQAAAAMMAIMGLGAPTLLPRITRYALDGDALTLTGDDVALPCVRDLVVRHGGAPAAG